MSEFCSAEGLSVRRLKWWVWKFGSEAAARPSAKPAQRVAPVVRIAQVVRAATSEVARPRGAIVIEVLEARLRITIEPGADREAVGAIVTALAGRPA
ncbi:MAG: hypothetical protein RL499_1016 [Actinomycetota bacterium]